MTSRTMSTTLEMLIIELRELGVKSLALELSDASGAPAIATSEDRATLAPDDLPCTSTCLDAPPDKPRPMCGLPNGHSGFHASAPDETGLRWQWAPDDFPPAPPVEPEFRGAPNQCAVVGCGEPNGGILGGKQRQYCRQHAFAQVGIK